MKKLFDTTICKCRAKLLNFRNKIYGNNFHRFEGKAAAVGLDGGDLVYNCKSVNGFAEDGVLSVEVAAAGFALNDVELRAAGFLHGIGDIALAGSGQGALLMVVTGNDFSLDLVSGAAGAELGLVLDVLCKRISALDHEVLDNAVEQQSVVEAAGCKLDEVVAVLGGVGVEPDTDGAH